MRFGICYNVEYRPAVHKSPSHYLGQILEQVELLEELGYDTVWFSEHHCAGYSFGNPAVMAASAAVRTKRIRIGIGVSLLPLHHPIFLSEEYGLLDVLSGGRLEYGIGRGFLMHEYDWLKIPRGESHDRYREAAEFIVKAWTTNDPMSFHGKFFDVDDYTYFPKPIQKPFPPIYASAATETSFKWAGEKGFNMGTGLFVLDVGDISKNLAIYRKSLSEHGHDPAGTEAMAITQMYCAPDLDEALADGRIFAENYYRHFAALSGDEFVSEHYMKVDALAMNAKDQLLIGDPDTLNRCLVRYRDDWGFDLVLMEIAQGGAPHDKICRALELFGKKVMPNFQGKNRPASRKAG